MVRRASKRQQGKSHEGSDRRDPPPTVIEYASRKNAARASWGTLWGIGVAALAVALASSLLLVLEHLAGLELPGCGKGSACAAAANSIWGKVPITRDFGWPVSFLGFAYFFGALIAWFSSRRGVAPLFRHVARLGAAISLFFIIVIVTRDYHCVYCLVSHAGNFAFWIVMERTRRGPVGTLRPLGALAGLFVVASAGLLGVELQTKGKVQTKWEQERIESSADIVAATTQMAALAQARAADSAATSRPTSQPVPAVTTTPSGTVAGPQPTPSSASVQTPGQLSPRPVGFRGRYLYGPEKAPIRLVMITDYQCVDCNRAEDDVRAMLQQRQDISLSIKHFPMCADCNSRFANQNMHRNACWAARAAEAAGIIGGNDGFWKMHFWLFDRDGTFSDQELRQGLVQLGFEPTQFIQIMMSEQTLKPVQEDIEEAVALGLHFTPMVFINGVELRGVFAKNAIPKTVAEVATHNPPPMAHELDHPPQAVEKYIGDWREGYLAVLPPDQHSQAMGPADAKVKIVMWGDFQETGTVGADGEIRAWIAGKGDVQYSFRHYPFNLSCNPTLQPTSPSHPQACRMSQAAEAAGQLGGVEGYWKMHGWLMSHLEDFSDDLLRQAATGLGFDAVGLFAAMDNAETAAAIQQDITAGRNLLYRFGIPTVYINGKVVPRCRLEGQQVLARILDEAYGKNKGAASSP